MTTGAIAKPPSAFAIFRNRSFTLLWIGQVIETIGCSLTSLAASILIFRLTGSAGSVGLMLMATSAPTILFGLLAGVVADRYDRKRILLIADILRAVLVVFIPFMITQGIAWLYIIVALSAAVTQFFDPAHESVLPEIATEEELAAANSLMAISSFGATAVGFAASGLIASRMPIEWAFYLNAIAYVFSAVMILAAPIRKFATSGGDAGLSAVGQNLRAGARVLINTPILKSLFLVFTLVFVSFGLSNSLLLPFAVTALSATEFEYGVQEAMTSIGFVIGSLMMAKMADRFREGLWIAAGFIAMALAGIGYSSMTAVAPAIAIITISGFINAPASIARRLVIQRNTPRDMRGRVNSAFFVCRDVLTILGMAAAGLADIFPVRIMYLVSALLLLAAGVWALFMPGLGQPAAEWKRALRLLREAPAAPGLATARSATLADFDALAGLLPSLSKLGDDDRQALIRDARVSEAAAGTTIIRHGEKADDAYFVLAGKAVAGIATEAGGYRSLSALNAGDFFGEIAALTGLPRTADVVAEQETRLLTVPATALRRLMADPALRQLVVSKMGERLTRTHTSDWPRLAGVDQAALRALRTTGEEIPS